MRELDCDDIREWGFRKIKEVYYAGIDLDLKEGDTLLIHGMELSYWEFLCVGSVYDEYKEDGDTGCILICLLIMIAFGTLYTFIDWLASKGVL